MSETNLEVEPIKSRSLGLSIVELMMLVVCASLVLPFMRLHQLSWNGDFVNDGAIWKYLFVSALGVHALIGVSVWIVVVQLKRLGFRRHSGWISIGFSSCLATVVTAFTLGMTDLIGTRIRHMADERSILQTVQDHLTFSHLEKALAAPGSYATSLLAVWTVLWFGKVFERPRGLLDWVGFAAGILLLALAIVDWLLSEWLNHFSA